MTSFSCCPCRLVEIFSQKSHVGRATSKGFTLIELVVVIMILGILAVSVLPRFSSLNEFDGAGFANQLRATLRYAQKTAIAQRRQAVVVYSAGAASICTQPNSATPSCAAADCTADVMLPGGSFRAGPSAVVAGGTLCFDARGTPYGGGPFNIPVAGSGAIVIEAGTGYVH